MKLLIILICESESSITEIIWEQNQTSISESLITIEEDLWFNIYVTPKLFKFGRYLSWNIYDTPQSEWQLGSTAGEVDVS